MQLLYTLRVVKMKKYLLVYRGAIQPDNGKKHMSDWMEWAKGMGDAMLDPGLPIGSSKTVSKDNVVETESSNPICGMTVIQAADLEVALKLSAACPHIAIGGTIEVAEAMDMPMA